MVNDRGTEETWTDWDSGGPGTKIGMFIGLAVGAGIFLFILRRVFAPKPKPIEVIADTLPERVAALFGNDGMAVGRELLGDKVLPELKPVLKALLREIEASVSQGFKRAERAIDDI